MKKVIRILLGNSNVYLIKGEKGYLLIDAGFPNTVKTFLNALEKNQ
jgi:glyoxylase-like metal-dependent hydrolase (beta-lactamase superfamily II)